MGQMIPITLPADGNWPTIVGDSIMIIGPRQNELTEEQRYFNPVYLMTYPGKEHLKAQMIRAGACDCDPTIPNRRIGVFSVAPDKKVSFSQGNLQYLPAINLWKFANTQYEYLGNANKYLKPTFRNWVDLFGWSANNTTAPFGVSTSTNAADYASTFVDWGENEICGDAPSTWRTLSADEWEYLLNGRENAAKLMGHAQINEINGFIFLPDDWHCPNDINFQLGLQQYADQTFTIDQWTRLEQAGAVFLPAAGRREGTELLNLNEYGNYWSATLSKSNFASYFAFNHGLAYVDALRETYFGRPVRLVHDTIVPQTIPDPCFIVKVNDTLSINMMCVEGGTFTMGDGENAHPVSLSNYSIAQTEVTQGLWEQVMGYNNSLFKGEYLPVEKVSWEECQTFIQKLNEMTGKHFRLPTEAEWEYAARGGKNSHGYTYAGSNSIDSVAWYQSNSQEQTHTIATLMPNELGIYDMSGNVWEWCEDYYDTDETMHVVKSGSFYDLASTCRIDFRTARLADYKSYIGLRLVLDERSITPEPEYVDLGLSVKWATFNVGATSPEDYGDYFAWGETEPKETYSWATYKWCDGTSSNITKYNTADGKTILEPADDAAQVHWGGNWRMPTKDEMQELFTRCTWKEENQNGINGYNVIGPNGNSIFVPMAGWYNEDLFGEGVQGNSTYYWTSTLSPSKELNAYDLVFNDVSGYNDGISANTRRCGFTIRPVYDDKPPKRIGVFSVAADKQVSFSQGNLQYTQSTDEWRFAREQYEYIGKGNITNGQLGQIIDMFGWSADADPANKWGVTIAQEGFDGDFVDWGLNYIHGEAPGSWRTLSQDEWSYLLSCRQHATELWGVAQVAGVNGVIILPDRWSPTDDLPFVAGINENGYAAQQTLSVEQWQLMEELGAVFLPAAGGRDGASLASSHIDRIGWYWLSTPTDPGKASCVRFECNLMVQRNGWRQAGLSVRLVHDTIVPKPEPEYVDLGLSVKWATFNVGATSPNEIGNFYAWGEIEPKDTYTVKNYKWWNESSKEITKYCTIDSLAYGDVADGLTELQPQDDIAHVLKGKQWRMPNLDECKELGNGCTWTVSTRQGQIGFEGTSKINGNTIFLPVVGFRAGADLVHETLGGYWSSTLNIEKQSCAMGLYLNLETPSVGIYYNSSRQNGFLIRPVYDEVPDPCLVVKVNDTISINLMCVEGGTFMMGSDAPDAQADEQPVHEVTLSDYYIGQTEVTQHLWKKVMGDENNPSAVKGNNLPVTNITWDETQQFVERLSELTGLRFRLPTEAEWEYAARGGQRSKGYTYAGSNDIDQVGWYNGNSSNKTHIVGQKQPNELGIYDMTGNVWEYCYDWHTPYAAQAQTNPTGAATGDKHVLRGGCYHYDPKNCTNTNRHSYYTPDKGGASTGLRIVLEP